MTRKSSGMAREVFQSDGCLGSLQEWWMKSKSSGPEGVKEVFNNVGCQRKVFVRNPFKEC